MNEISLLILAFADYSLLFLASYFGPRYVRTSVVVNLILVSIFARKFITIFGYTTNLTNIFYSGVVLGMGILCERFDFLRSRRVILLGFFSLLSFVILSQIAIHIFGTDGAYAEVFLTTPRIAFASFLAYMIGMYYFVNFYASSSMNLWEKYIIFTVLIQALDSVIFFLTAFLGTLPPFVIAESMIVGFLLKSGLGVVSSPFLYLSTKIPNRHSKE